MSPGATVLSDFLDPDGSYAGMSGDRQTRGTAFYPFHCSQISSWWLRCPGWLSGSPA